MSAISRFSAPLAVIIFNAGVACAQPMAVGAVDKVQAHVDATFADAVLWRRAMQARVEVEVGFAGRVRAGAEDGPVVLLLHKNAGPSASTRRRCWPARATYI
jgi:hypothetical protein